MGVGYFDGLMVNRQRLLWVIATRRQLERWEASLAIWVQRNLTQVVPLPDAELWSAESERHLALVAAGNLLDALALDPPSTVPIDRIMRDDLIDGRNVHEHWTEHMPIFSTKPLGELRLSGKSFADRNPERDPFWALGWGNKTGAMLLPNVSAAALHEFLDAVEAEVLSSEPGLSLFIPARAESPWVFKGGEWWPKPEADP
jgi:hypothetical protein